MTEFAMTSIGDIAEGPNVRTKLGDLSELAASLGSQGMLQPVTVRPKGDGLELVFGFRRFRAAKLAGLAEVPTLSRELNDDQVLEAQLLENVERLSMDPIDEAQGYKQLIAHGKTTAEIAAKMGRPPAYVAQRLRLCGLSETTRDAMHQEEISLGVALLIAKLPTPALQDKALEQVQRLWDPGQPPIPVAEAKRIIEEEVMRDLNTSPFDRKSLELVPAAGSCVACPKRTGAQAELFADGTSPDLCTDPVCFRSKLDAHWVIAQKLAKEGGIEVLPKAKAEQAVRYHEGGDSGYRKLTDVVYFDGGKKKTVRQLLGKDAEPVAIARDEHTGAVVELVTAKEADAAIKAARKAAGEKDDAGPSAHQKAEAEERKAAKSRRAELTASLVHAVETKCRKPGQFTVALLKAILHGAVEIAGSDAHKTIVSARELREFDAGVPGEPKTSAGEILHDFVTDSNDFGVLLGLLVELLTSRGDSFDDELGGGDSSGLLALDALGLDAKDIGSRDTKPEKPSKAKQKGLLVHLSGGALSPNGTACGAKPGTGTGSGARTFLEGVTCKSCIRVGPAILAQGKPRKAKAMPLPKKKKAPKAGPKKGKR